MYSLDISNVISCSMFGRMRQTNGWNYKATRKINTNLFVFMIKGTATFYVEDIRYNISAGDILIIPSETLYSAKTEDFCEYFFFHFSGKIEATHSEPVFDTVDISFSFNLRECKHKHIFFTLKTCNKTVYEKIYASIINCIEYQTRSTHTGRLLLDTEFLKIMLILGESTEIQCNSIPAALNNMIKYIKKNLTKPLSLCEVSCNCSVSMPYASRLFRKHLNMTAIEYINREKIFYAYELLQNTSMKIGEISEYLGYSDIAYFSKLFKKELGKSPSKFRL